MADKAEVKLGKSLDQIIEENRKKLATNKPRDKGPRGDKGPKRGHAGHGIVAAAKAQSQGRERAPRNLSVQGGGIGKRRGGGGGAAASFMHDDRTGPVADFEDDYGGGGYGGGRGRGGRGGRGGRRGPVAGNPEGAWSHDMFEDEYEAPARGGRMGGVGGGRMGAGGAAPADPSCKLLVDNLAYKVSESDLVELFSTCGGVERVRIQYSRDGRPTGRATVLFARPQDVQRAIKEYNGVKLDTLELELRSGEEVAPAGGRGPRAAAGGPPRLSSGLVIQKPGARLGGGGGGAGPSGGRMFQQAVPRGMMGGSGRGGRGGRGGGGGGGGRLRSTVARSREELDAEMDAMME
eukprot:CAMPEP_0202858568 /NCGR_PEP_ID=MMETSP1391-20130828/1042_1 /ASSEMBLY_ACC=CAM_ASM_000867 /TAXON_ID=1034604 /ORGANISM="Chlamydomonas leiostraca, Strain SAG 11-49" /LENGTH=348 /DNA_ID=CAMNT_0049537495 /DNA_START=21 /DNA_END=1067 /DNA_ORIENTATION=+